jgi:hypothetical protein
MLARSETGGTSSEQPGGARYKTRCLYPLRRLGPICQPASICVTTLGSTEIPIEGKTSSDVYRQPRRKTTRKRKNKSLPSSNEKRIDPSGGVSTMFLGSRAVGHALRFRFRKKMGGVLEHTSQDDLQNAIWTNIHHKQFYFADKAPLCSRNLCGMFGYNAISDIARSILAGTYEYPPDFNQATREIFEECARI